MVQSTEAIYTNGMFKPTEKVELPDQQRVRLVFEPIDVASEEERAAALQEFLERARRMKFRSTGPYPTRDELHERR